ncbi:MAG: adenylosuccinate lyase [bacterium]|jgi:adenylosuccinate lyase|nr:adenylosuccinate lyase [bacterium]
MEINNISAVDGRYSCQVKELRDIFSEYGLIKHRVFVETEWLKFILNGLGFQKLTSEQTASIDSIFSGFNRESALMIKKIESTTNHDVKAVEYYIKEQLENRNMGAVKEWVHFCCTSEDINNCSYALMIKEGKAIVSVILKELLTSIEALGLKYRSVPMMSRTHGQPASPTTVGKEFINFAARIQRELKLLEKLEVECKFNGATGNFNAHHFSKPEIDWIAASEKFITENLMMKPLLWTTQINNYHYISETFHILIRIASTLTDLDRDMWSYVSLGYFKQKTKEGEIGSSTMPHKVNPIDFENSEGNAGIAVSLMEHLSTKLLNSRMQRDLTDSTVLRNIGTVFGHLLISIKNCLKGLSKIEINEKKIIEDLDDNLELLAEPVQTVMRVHEEENPYEKLKMLTRGRKIDVESLHKFIDSLEKVPSDIKKEMKDLKPSDYTGIAEKLVDLYFKKRESL